MPVHAAVTKCSVVLVPSIFSCQAESGHQPLCNSKMPITANVRKAAPDTTITGCQAKGRHQPLHDSKNIRVAICIFISKCLARIVGGKSEGCCQPLCDIKMSVP